MISRLDSSDARFGSPKTPGIDASKSPAWNSELLRITFERLNKTTVFLRRLILDGPFMVYMVYRFRSLNSIFHFPNKSFLTYSK